MRAILNDVALEVMKTLITSDQPELITQAEDDGIKTVDAVAAMAFDFAAAFVSKADEYHNQ